MNLCFSCSNVCVFSDVRCDHVVSYSATMRSKLLHYTILHSLIGCVIAIFLSLGCVRVRARVRIAFVPVCTSITSVC